MGNWKKWVKGGQWWKNITLLESADNNNNLWSWITLTPFWAWVLSLPFAAWLNSNLITRNAFKSNKFPIVFNPWLYLIFNPLLMQIVNSPLRIIVMRFPGKEKLLILTDVDLLFPFWSDSTFILDSLIPLNSPISLSGTV